MGSTASRESNLKLEARKIKDFACTHEDWQKWKSQTECEFSGSGYEKVLENARYAMTHMRLNKIVYSQLAASTVDGTAYHLVQKYKKTKMDTQHGLTFANGTNHQERDCHEHSEQVGKLTITLWDIRK
jgi:hypothetical protein